MCLSRWWTSRSTWEVLIVFQCDAWLWSRSAIIVQYLIRIQTVGSLLTLKANDCISTRFSAVPKTNKVTTVVLKFIFWLPFGLWLQWRLVNRGGAVAHWHSKQFHKQLFTINQTVRLIWTPLPSVFLPKFSSQTDIGVEIVQSSVRLRHCHVIENCAATDHETSLDFSSWGRQKNRPFQLRSEDADWLNFMSHLEYINILNQDPVGDFSIAPRLKSRRADRQRGHIVMVKTYIFHRRFSNISHHGRNHHILWGGRVPNIGKNTNLSPPIIDLLYCNMWHMICPSFMNPGCSLVDL